MTNPGQPAPGRFRAGSATRPVVGMPAGRRQVPEVAMELHRFAEAADFYRRAEGFLLTDEAQHNLIIGICASLRQGRDYTEHAPYLATVEDGDGVVAAAIRTPPYNLLLSLVRTPDDAATRRALAPIAADAHREYGTLPGVQGAAAVSRAFAALWHG